MASTIKQRLRRYNGTDYDTIHLESSSEQILRPSNSQTTTVENGLLSLDNHFYKTNGLMTTSQWYRIFACNAEALYHSTISCLSMIISIHEFNWYRDGGTIMVAISCVAQHQSSAAHCSGFTMVNAGTPHIDKIRIAKMATGSDTIIDAHYNISIQGNDVHIGFMSTAIPINDATVGVEKVDDEIPSEYTLLYTHTI